MRRGGRQEVQGRGRGSTALSSTCASTDCDDGGLPATPQELQEFLADSRPDAYERLLTDVIRGDQTLFMRRDEVEAAWQWIDPILNGWAEYYQAPHRYAAGSNGPAQAVGLIERDGYSWADPDMSS